MSAGNVIVYDSFKVWLGDGTFDMNADTFNVMLVNNAYTPSISTHSVLADITDEVANGNGYLTGGAVLASVTWTKSGSTTKFDAADPSWTASGAPVGPFRKGVIYKDGTANAHVSPLVGYCVLDASDITIGDGNTFSIRWAAAGILTLTGATS